MEHQNTKKVDSKSRTVDDVKAIMLKLIVHPDFSMIDIVEIIAQIERELPEETLIIFATEINFSISIENLKVSIVAIYNEH